MQSWEMTRDEYVKDSMSYKRKHGIYGKGSFGGAKLLKAEAAKWHKILVKDALEKGKPVPPEVLKDYPDLMKKEESRMNRAKNFIRIVEEDLDLFSTIPQNIPDLSKAVESLGRYGFKVYGEPYSNPVIYTITYRKGRHRIVLRAYKERKTIFWVYLMDLNEKQSGNDAESLERLLKGITK